MENNGYNGPSFRKERDDWMKPKIILYSDIKDEIRKELEDACEVIFVHMDDECFVEKVAPFLSEVEGIIGDGLTIDRSMIERIPNLKVISNISVGYDNLDIEAINEQGIVATNTPEVLTETTADLMFTLIMCAARKVTQLDRYVKEGKWNSAIGFDLFGTDIHDKTLGVIGMGRIGKAIARRGKFGFNMQVLYHNRSRNIEAEEELDVQYCELDELLQKADFICLMTPLKDDTYNLIGMREFELMKGSAIFINGSRGYTVDEQALITALETGQIAAAGLDVFQQEPVSIENPLLKMDHVITLPHVGSDTHENKLRMDDLGVKNLLKVLRGEKPLTPINPEILQ